MEYNENLDVILLSNPPSSNLNEIFTDIPKIFIPFFDSILLDYYLYFLKHFHFKNIFIIFLETNTDIADYYLGSWFPENFLLEMELNIFRETHIIGNIGAIKKIEKYIISDNVIVLNTGSVPKFDISKAIKKHIEKSNNVTIVTTNSNNFFSKEPTISGNYCFILKKELLNLVPEGKYIDFKNKFKTILQDNSKLIDFHIIETGLFPLLSFEDYINIVKDFIKYPENYMSPMLEDFIINTKEITAIHKKAFSRAYSIKSSVIGRNSILKKNSTIKESIISDNVVVGEGATIEKSFIKPSTVIEDNAFIVVNIDSINLKSLLGSPVVEEKAWERFFDLFLLILSLPVTIPLLIIISLTNLILEGRPVFFVQERLGKNGKPFKMIKFRTMRKDADKFKEMIKDMNEIDGPMFKISNDPRITKFGRFLRKTSLDELPQLFNILKGEMNFVGPRPLEDKEMTLHPQWRDLRLKVKPGLTGLWQVMKSKDESFSEWIEYDTYYITHKSPFLYFKIIFLTFLSVLKRKNK